MRRVCFICLIQFLTITFLLSTIATPLFAGERVLHSFNSNGTDGFSPAAGVILDAAGNLYGTTYAGGDYNSGTVFQLTKGNWTEKVLYSFNNNGTDGYYPATRLIFDAAGNLYGTTWAGGANSTCSGGCGTVFQLIPGTNNTWTEQVLYSFNNNGTDGNRPLASLILDAAGNLYGTTTSGGAYDYGTVFEITPGVNGTWTETVLYSFNNNGADGYYPEASLIFDAAGNLYGTTSGGGTYASGTVFQLIRGTNAWSEAVLYNLTGSGAPRPVGGLIFDAAGNLYGTTYQGGTYGYGMAFKLTLSKGKWTEKVLHSFNDNGKDGYNPYSSLIFDAAGNLYGMTLSGGAYTTCPGNQSCGTVFKLTLTKGKWTEKVLHSFNDNGKDGYSQPFQGTADPSLVFVRVGTLYGTTYWGGTYVTGCYDQSCGTVFEVTP